MRNPKIFISYRRDENAGHAGRLHADLVHRFGPGHVFFDINAISPGEDFAQVIQQAVSSCDVIIAVIGKHWLSAGDDGVSRLENPNDFVRLELSAALNRNIPVIPVLIQAAKIPRPDELPKALEPITRLQALEISDDRWDYDIRRLYVGLKQVIPRRIVSLQTIVIISGFLMLLTLGLVGLIHRNAPIVRTDASNSTRLAVKEVYVFESDDKFKVRLGIGKGPSSNNHALYSVNYILSDNVCGIFVERINTSVAVGENLGAQAILDGNLNEAQRNFLNGEITPRARRLVSEAKAKKLLVGNNDEELNTLVKDENLDTLIASIVDLK